MPEILVTGATGFVGKAVVHRLLAEDESRKVAVALGRDIQQWIARVVPRLTGDLELDLSRFSAAPRVNFVPFSGQFAY